MPLWHWLLYKNKHTLWAYICLTFNITIDAIRNVSKCNVIENYYELFVNLIKIIIIKKKERERENIDIFRINIRVSYREAIPKQLSRWFSEATRRRSSESILRYTMRLILQ